MDDIYNKIIHALSGEKKPLMIKTIAEKCNFHPQTVARKLETLEALGRVRKIQMGHAKKYYLVDTLQVSGLIDISSDFILILNTNHIIQYINKSAEKILALKNCQIIGKQLESLHLDMFSSPEVLQGLQKFSPEKVFRAEIPYSHDGSMYWYQINIMSLALKTNNVLIAIVVSDITTKREAELKLRDSEARCRLISENTTDVIWLLDATTFQLLYISPSISELTGYQSDEILGVYLHEFLVQSSEVKLLQSFHDRIERFLAGDESARICQYDIEHVHKNGFYIQAEMVTTLLTDKSGTVTRILGVSRDVTERKKTEMALKKTYEQISVLGEILKCSFQPIIVMNPDLTIDYCNSAFETLIGYTLNELRNINLINPIGYEKWITISRSLVKQVKVKRRPVMCEYTICRPDGREVHLEISTHMILSDEGMVVRYYALITDITQRKRTDGQNKSYQDQLERLIQDRTHSLQEEIEVRIQIECELRKNEERFRQVAETSGTWVWEIDRNGIFQYSSQVGIDITGYSPNEVVGKKYYEFFHPDSRKELITILHSVSVRHECIRHFQIDLVHKNGSIIRVESNGLPIFNENGIFSGYRGTMIDVTDNIQMEHALVENRKYYRSLFEHTPIPLILVDTDSLTILDGNKAASRFFGYSLDELVGQKPHILTIQPGLGVDALHSHFERNLNSGRNAYEVIYLKANGILWSGRASLIHIEIGGKSCILYALQDSINSNSVNLESE
jgi:PAS domain S-box-containing protein